MKKMCLAATLFLLALLAPLDAYASKKVSAPVFKGGSKIVAYKKVSVEIASYGGKTYYTTDGTTPTNKSKRYKKPITIKKNTTVKAITYDGKTKSKVSTCSVKCVDTPVKASLDKSKNYKGKQTLYLSTDVTNAKFYYSVNNGETYKKIGKKTKVTLGQSSSIKIYGKEGGKYTKIDEMNFHVDLVGIKAKYASGVYNKPIKISFSTKKSCDEFGVSVCKMLSSKISATLKADESYELTKGTHLVLVAAKGTDGKISSKIYTYRIK